MILVVDIGNTNIVCALFKNNVIQKSWRVFSDGYRSENEYASSFSQFISQEDINDIQEIFISSVKPTLNSVIAQAFFIIAGKEPIFLSPQHYSALPIQIPETAVHEVGSDLVCNMVAAFLRFQSSVLIVDFGTALTFTAVDKNGEVKGVAITAGLQTAIKSLFKDTAQLPSVPLSFPPHVLGTNTVHAIQAGVLWGYTGMVAFMIEKIKEDYQEDFKVIATGGLSQTLSSKLFDQIDINLTLTGLHHIAKIILK